MLVLSWDDCMVTLGRLFPGSQTFSLLATPIFYEESDDDQYGSAGIKQRKVVWAHEIFRQRYCGDV